jgi:MFS family permease
LGRSTALNASGVSGQPIVAEPDATPHPGIAFALLGVVQAALTGAIAIVLLALPAIQRELGLTAAEMVLVSAGPGLAFSGLLLLGGRLADMFGQRRIFVIGLVLFGLAAAAAGIAPGHGVLLAARFAQGVGAALAAPAAMALLGSVYVDPGARARAFAVWGMLASLGATAGTLLSGAVVTWVSWRWAFVLPVLVAVVAVLAAPRVLPTGPPPAPMRLDVPGALLVTAGLTIVSYGLVQIGEAPWTAPSVRIPLVLGTALLIGFVAVEARAGEPLVPLSFFASARRSAALFVVLLIGAVSSTIFFFLALYFLQVRGWPPLLTSAAFLPFGVALIVSSVIAGPLIGRAGLRPIAVAGLVITAIGLLLFSRLQIDTPYLLAMLPAALIFQIGAGLALGATTVVAVVGVPEDEAGLTGGVLNAAQQIGPTLGLAVLVSVAGAYTARLAAGGLVPAAAQTGGYAFALGVAGLICLLSAGMAFVVLGARRRSRAISHGT